MKALFIAVMPETQYDHCIEHITALSENVVRLSVAMQTYKESDHHSSMLDSPFILEMNEELIALNAHLEQLIRRVDPSFEGEYSKPL